MELFLIILIVFALFIGIRIGRRINDNELDKYITFLEETIKSISKKSSSPTTDTHLMLKIKVYEISEECKKVIDLIKHIK